MSGRHDVFLSYAHNDKSGSAEELAAWLAEHGLSCWIDHEELRAGTEYDTQILQAIRRSRVVLALVSKGSVESKYVPFEVSAAIGINKPVVLAFVENLAHETLGRPFNAKASGIQYRKLYLPEGLEKEKSRLLRDLREHCAQHRSRQWSQRLIIGSILAGAILVGWLLPRTAQGAKILTTGPQQLGTNETAAFSLIGTNNLAPSQTPIGRALNSFHNTRPVVAVAVSGLKQGAKEWTDLGADSSLASGDAYIIRAYSMTAGYLYIFQQDASGKIWWLYPRNNTVPYSEGANPLPAFREVALPADGQTGLILDESTGIEHLVFVYSATPFPELESWLRSGSKDLFKESDFNLIAAKGVAGTGKIGLNRPATSRIVSNALLPPLEDALEGRDSWVVVHRSFRHTRP